MPPYRDPPGAVLVSQMRTLPPYREPPPPDLHTPSRAQFFSTIPNTVCNYILNLYFLFVSFPKDLQDFQEAKVSNSGQNIATVAYTQRYVELIRLVNKQRDTINNQQADLTKVRKASEGYFFVTFIFTIINLVQV